MCAPPSFSNGARASIAIAKCSMSQVLIRELDAETVQRLKERAGRNGRSLEAELRVILERAAGQDVQRAAALASDIRCRLAGRKHSDSATLVSEDRKR